MKPIVIMDIIHISSFGNLCYIHVTIDTFSQFIWTATESGETAKHVQRHLYACFAVIKLPKAIKTDNDPAYTSKAFQQFLKIWSIKHSTGIPYNPQGQVIMERANQSLKHRIQKQKGGDAIGQQTILNKALFTLNFLNILAQTMESAAEQHFQATPTSTSKPVIWWQDPLTNAWSPGKLITWGRGFACIFPGEGLEPVWIPARRVKLSRNNQ